MVAGPTRPDAEVRDGLERWLNADHRDLGASVVDIARPTTGWSNETVLIATESTRFVMRLPALVPAYPDYDLAAQADVLRALESNEIPVPSPIAVESDPRWLGAPFLLMEWVGGRALGEVPALDPVLQAGSAEQRRHMHEQFADALSAVHRIDDVSLLPRLRRGLADELAFWSSYLDWSSNGAPPKRLVDALAWCKDSMPRTRTNVLLWGDPRLGNAMYDGDTLIALLDWELASFGPPEMDLAWYLALGELTAAFMGANPAGMLTDDEFVRRYEDAVGSKPQHLAWHQIFALVRSTAVNDCMARLAHAHGLAYPGIAGDNNPLLQVIWARIASVNS